MKRVIYLVAIFSFFYISQAKSQTNLVTNPSFEIYTSCPPGYINLCPPWVNPTTSTNGTYLTIFFNKCSSNGCCGVPSNIFGSGYQYARTGNSYATAFFLQAIGGNVRDYSQIPLTDSLKSGHCYYVEFYVNLVNRSAYACNNIGLYISKTAPTFTPGQVIAANPQIINYSNKIISDTLNWIKVSGIYIAQGGEQYITIGNFKPDAQTDTLITHNPLAANCAQYNIDDVSVIPLDSFNLKVDAGSDASIANVGDSVFIGSLTNGLTGVKWYNANNIEITNKAGVPGFYVKPAASTFYIIEQTICGYYSRDTVNITVGTVPLKFISYSVIASATKQSVENIWTTANEINVSHFNIQRSLNGSVFTTIGKLSANNKSYNEYSFIDVQFPSLEGLGVVYYKIESVDFNGRKQYSETRTLNLKPQTLNGISIYPNPSKGIITITLPATDKGFKTLKVTNAYGKTIAERNIFDRVIMMDLKTPAGVYFLNITNIITGKTETQKLIINN